jgi:hypothetical protein
MNFRNAAADIDPFAEDAEEQAERSVPVSVKITSPNGTTVSLPLLVNREDEYKETVGAGFQTHAFSGETLDGPGWTIECEGEDAYHIVHAQIIAPGLPPESPGARLFRAGPG